MGDKCKSCSKEPVLELAFAGRKVPVDERPILACAVCDELGRWPVNRPKKKKK